MKKTVLFGIMALLTGCACPFGSCQQENTAPVVSAPETAMTEIPVENAMPYVPVDAPAVLSMPCSSACGKQNCEPMVLKPRVIEVAKSKKKRPCCSTADEYILFDEDEPYVPDAPEIYVISANRTVNSMLTEAEAFYKTVGPLKIYIDKVMEHGWAYGSKGTALAGKSFIVSITMGAPENAYAAEGVMKHTVEEFTYSVAGFAALCKLDCKKLFSIGGTMYVPGITTDEQKAALIDKCKKQAADIIDCLKNL
mgnify:CR=1 FL=1